MSDESPPDESPAHDAQTEQSPAAAGDEGPATEGPPAAPPPPGEPPARRGFWVPRWAAFVAAAVVAVLVLFFGGFAIGRATDSGGGGEARESRERTEREAPRPERPGEARPASGVFLGVATRDAPDQGGAEIVDVASGSPAAQAGLQARDVVTDVDGTAIKSASDLRQQVRSRQSGDQVTITYTRNGTSSQTQVTLGNRSSTGTPSA
jgi:membrane-associated protease RseP (regulator of RpoE activity)